MAEDNPLPVDEANEELDELWKEMKRLDVVEGELDEYLTVDDDLPTGGPFTLAEISVNDDDDEEADELR